MRLLMLTAALAPALVWLTYFRERDRFGTDTEDVWSAFLTGALMALVVGGIVYLVGVVIHPFHVEGLHSKVAAEAFFMAAMPEEAAKLAAVVILFRRHSDFARPYDLVAYAVAVSAGFAALENMFYVDADEWQTIAVLRSITAVPSHIFSGAIMGACLAAAQFGARQRLRYNLLAWLLPVLFHGVYDYCAILENTIRDENLSQHFGTAAFAYESFILIVVMEGWLADRCARGTSRMPLPPGVTQVMETKPSWHWMNWPRLRKWVWGASGTLISLAGLLVLASALFASRTRETAAPRYIIVGMGIFAVYHGLAFIAQARRVRRA